MSLSMVALAVSYEQLHQPEKNMTAAPAQIVFLFVFNSFFALGWLGMTWLYPAEIVPLRIRAPTNALSTRYANQTPYFNTCIQIKFTHTWVGSQRKLDLQLPRRDDHPHRVQHNRV